MRENDIRTLPGGSHFNFKGFQWVVLDNDVDGGVLAIMASAWNGEGYHFDEDCCNNYAKASLRRKLRNELLPALGEDNLIPHEVDLTADNGDDRYGTVTDKVFILSCDEYRKYRKNIPPRSGWVWTCTPWYITDPERSHHVRYVSMDDFISDHIATSSNGVLPACVFNPEKVKIEYQFANVKEKRNE